MICRLEAFLQGMPALLSGGPTDLPPGTRYNGWTGMYDSVSDIASQDSAVLPDHFSLPSPSSFPHQPDLDSNDPGSVRLMLHGASSLKRPAPALATKESLQVVQKVRYSKGGSQG
jgi:hypothetical protein